MWKVECSRCGDLITAESPDEIAEDVNGDPRHDDCPYADEPTYPHTFTMTVRSSESAIKSTLKRAFPHLTPRLEEQRLEYVVPEELFDLGHVRLQYRADSNDGFWDADFRLTHVDGEPLASNVPRLVYECDECGTRVDGQVVYKTDGHLPFVHRSCPEARNGTFVPVDVSHLDRTLSEEEHDEVLASYQQET